MSIHDFLTRSLDLLTLLTAVEQRQAAIAALIAELEVASVTDSGRGAVLAQLQTEHHEVGDELDRAFVLLSGF